MLLGSIAVIAVVVGLPFALIARWSSQAISDDEMAFLQSTDELRKTLSA